MLVLIWIQTDKCSFLKLILKKSADDNKSMKNYQAFKFSQHSHTVKPVLSGHSKIDKTKVLKTNGSLMKVESIAECSLGAFCNTFDLH